MKRNNWIVFFTIILFVSFFGGSPMSATSDEPKSNVDPFIYDRLKFKKNTDYLHDTKKIEMKNTIPVKQFDIKFDGSKKLPERGDASRLFRAANRTTKSTVSAKASEIGLFSNEKVGAYEVTSAKRDAEHRRGNQMRTVVFLSLIAVGMVVLFVMIIPKLLRNQA